MPTWLPLSSSKGSSLWLLWIVVYQGIPLFRRIWKTPCCTNPHFKGSRLGPRSYYLKTYFIALFLTIPKLSLYFLQVFWLWSNIVLKNRRIWSGHPVYYTKNAFTNAVSNAFVKWYQTGRTIVFAWVWLLSSPKSISPSVPRRSSSMITFSASFETIHSYTMALLVQMKNPQPKYVNALKIIIHHDLSLLKQSIHCKKTYIHRIRAADPDPVGFGEFWPTSFYWIRIQILPVYEYMM